MSPATNFSHVFHFNERIGRVVLMDTSTSTSTS